MSELIATLLPYLITSLGGGSFATIVGYFFLRPKTTTEAAKNRAEASGVDVGSQNRIIEGWKEYAADLEARLTRSDARITAIEQRESLLSFHVFAQTLWIQKSYLVMTEEQRKVVGHPPVIDAALISPATPEAPHDEPLPTPPPEGGPNG